MTDGSSLSSLPPVLRQTLSAAWNVILLRSICAVIFGAIALFWPGVSLLALVFVYAVYSLADGLLAIFAGIRGGGAQSRWWLILGGLCGLIVGGIALALPELTAAVFVILLGAVAVVRGVTDIIGAIKDRDSASHKGILVLTGILSIIFGLILFAAPMISAIAITWVIGFWALMLGVAGIVFAFKLKSAAKSLTS